MKGSLPPEDDELIETEIASGPHPSRSDVAREALRLLSERDRLREKIEQGLAEASRGELVDGPEAFRAVKRRRRSAHQE